MSQSGISRFVSALRLLFFLAFVAGIVAIALYPVKNHAVAMRIYPEGGGVTVVSFSAEEVASLGAFSVDVPGAEAGGIREIRITRLFASVAVDKIPGGSVGAYAAVGNGEVAFNESAAALLRSSSRSAVMERLFFAELWLTLFLLLLIALGALGERLGPEVRGNHGPVSELRKFFAHISSYGRYMAYAANADLRAEVANSYLNRLWWLLEPLFNMLVYVVVFGRVMGRSVQNYATFVFSALLMWNFFSRTVNYSVKCIRMNRDIVTKVYVPKHVLLITDMVLNFFKLLFSLIVLVPMLLIFHVHVGLGALWVAPAYLLMVLLSFGVGMIFMHYGVYVDDLGYAVGILLQMLMFLSGVFYDVITSLPKPLNALMLCFNPVAVFMDSMRNALLGNIVCNVPLVALWTVISLLLCFMGIHIVYKNENSYVKVV